MNWKPFRNRCHEMPWLAATMAGVFTILPAAAFRSGEARAQNETEKPPAAVAAKPDDVKSMDAILAALYDTISGPAGERDWNRLRSLFHAECATDPVRPGGPGPGQAGDQGTRVDGRGVHQEPSEPRSESPRAFFEREIARRVERFGAVAHVFSTYESRHAANDPQPFVRGINSIQLFFDGTRWWIVTIFWDSERPGQAIPKELSAEEMTLGARDCNPPHQLTRLQERDAAGLDPLGDEDVALLVEACVVRMDELAGRPAVGLSADLEPIEHLFGPLGIVAQVDQHIVVLVEQA